MSSDASATVSDLSSEPVDAVAKQRALRIGFGAVVGFALGGLSGTAFFFLPPLMAVQFLATMREPPTLRQGFGLAVLMAFLSGMTLFLASAFAHQPLVYVMLIALTLFAGFLLDTAGKAMPATFLLVLGCMVPVVATQSFETAAALAAALVGASVIGILTVWAMFAAFPAPRAAVMAVMPVRQARPRTALVNTILLLPVLLLHLASGQTTVVVLIVIMSIIRLGDRSTAHLAALGLLLGNVLGGIVATVAYGLVTLQTSMVFFLLIVLLVGLAFGARIAAGDEKAPVFVISLVTFVLLLGIGVSPLPTDSGEAFTTRLWNVVLAGAYAVGALSLVPVQASDIRIMSSEREPQGP